MVTPCSSDQTSCALEWHHFCRDAKNRETSFLSARSGGMQGKEGWIPENHGGKEGGCSALNPLVGIPHKEVRQHLLACLSSPCTSLGYQPALRRSLQGLFVIFIIYFIFLEVSLCSLYQLVNLRAPGVKSSERPYNSGLLFHHENCCHPGTARGLAPCLPTE